MEANDQHWLAPANEALRPSPPHWLEPTNEALLPPPHLNLSEWADLNFYLSVESSAEPGRWTSFPYQRGIMDAITDPEVEQVTWRKSARVGATKIFGATIGYFMDHDPCPIMVVQPTLDDARDYSEEEIVPMFRDCKVLAEIMAKAAKKYSQKKLKKYFPGGLLHLTGANSGAGFRRVSRRVVLFDEVDGYPASAGHDGDPIKLGIKRTEFYGDRKIIAASTPLIEGTSRITKLFEDGDQRRYHVPCPQCSHRDILVFRRRDDGVGHYMEWPKDKPEEAYFVCSENGCVIEHSEKFAMVEGGVWIAEKEFIRHASFDIWAAYSFSPNASWGQIAKEFIEASKAGPEELQTFINTVLGETFVEKGEAPSWERLYHRRESYAIGTIPKDAQIATITCGVDVQRNRWVYEVVGWGHNKESWSLDAGIIFGDPGNFDDWEKIDELLARTYGGRPISMMAVDSGDQTQMVYSWCSTQQLTRVIAVKGQKKGTTLVAVPTSITVKASGRRRRRGYKLWNVAVSMAKSELYGFLKLMSRGDGTKPPGYCHFPEYGEEFFLELTGEHLVRVKHRKTGHMVYEWHIIPGRENHFLDCRVYARAAAYVLGLDRLKGKPPAPRKRPASPESHQVERETPTSRGPPRRHKPGSFMKGKGAGFMKGRR